MYNKSHNNIIVSNNNTKRMETTGEVTAISEAGQCPSIADQHLQIVATLILAVARYCYAYDGTRPLEQKLSFKMPHLHY